MELDDLKLAWQTLDRRLDLQKAISLHQFKEGKLDKTRASLRRLYWGQIVQILFGDAMILVGIFSSMHNQAVTHLLLCSVCIFLYGLATVIGGGVTLNQISRIDYSAPVIDIQKQVAALRRTYIVSGLGAGLPWWLLWIPVLVLEVRSNLGVDLFVTASEFIWISVGTGIAGLYATWWVHRWSRSPQRPRLARAIDHSVTGRSLRVATSELDEIARFERM